MKTIRINIAAWLERQEKNWRALPLEKQRTYTLWLFSAYMLLTAAVILKVCRDLTESPGRLIIEHIESPAGSK